MAASWGSLLGLGYVWLWGQIPSFYLRCGVALAGLLVAVWAASRCERLFSKKDPSSVVIDEIAPMPLAFWPLLAIQEHRWPVWLAAFCVYRVADFLKPWPARASESLKSGWGIVMDDVISSLYMGGVLWGTVTLLKGTLFHG